MIALPCFAYFSRIYESRGREPGGDRKRDTDEEERGAWAEDLPDAKVNPNTVELQPLVNWYGVKKKSCRLFWFVIQSKLYKKKQVVLLYVIYILCLCLWGFWMLVGKRKLFKGRHFGLFYNRWLNNYFLTLKVHRKLLPSNTVLQVHSTVRHFLSFHHGAPLI